MNPTVRRLRPARLLSVLVMVGAVVFVGQDAQAAPTVQFECPEEEPSSSQSPSPTPSSADCPAQEGSRVVGNVPVVFHVSTDPLEEPTRVELSLVSQDPKVDDPLRVWEGDEAVDGEYRHTWDSALEPGYNGRYELRVRVWAGPPGAEPPGPTEPPGAEEERVDLRVDNPPQLPPKPRVTGVTDEGVKVEWSEAPEPDVLHYTLYRARTESADQKPDASAFKEARVTEKTSVLDEVSNGGAYWYKLQVTRRSIVESDGGIASQLSARSDEAGVYVAPTPTPAPTPPPDGGPAGGGETVESTPRPRLTPRPLPRAERSGPPLPSDAPFSDTLPYDLPQDGSGGSGGADLAQGAEGDVGEPGDQGPLPAVAIGTFLVSAALALGRLPTT